MKKNLLLSFAYLSLLHAQAQEMVVGTAVTVLPGTTLFVEGNVQVTPGTSLGNNGVLQLTGDLTNQAGGSGLGGNGTVRLSGNSNQTITGAGTQFHHLEVNKSAGTAFLGSDIIVNGNLNFNHGTLNTTPVYTVELGPTATLVGEHNISYLQGNVTATRSISGNAPVDIAGMGVQINPQSQSVVVDLTRTAGLELQGISYAVNPNDNLLSSIDRIWEINSTPTINPLVANLSWLEADDNGLTDFSLAQVWRSTNGTNWATASPMTNANSRTISFTSSNQGLFTVSNYSNPLPVNLVRYSARREKLDALLEWETLSETGNAGYTLMVSTDGSNFNHLADVPAATLNSYQRQQYSYTDLTPNKQGPRYYKLLQHDLDGETANLGVRVVHFDDKGLTLTVFPNPFMEGFTAYITTDNEQEAYLILTDVTGKEINRQHLLLQKGLNQLHQQAISGLAAGVYHLTLHSNSLPIHARIIKK